MCCELQSGLDGFECPAVIWEGRHFKFHGSLDRELEPVVLMNVVEPGADDKSIHHLRKLIHHITSSALTFIWERECSENICRRGLPQHLSNHSVGVIGYFSEAVIVRSVDWTILFIKKSTGEITRYTPTRLRVWPQLDRFRTVEFAVIQPLEVMNDLPLFPFITNLPSIDRSVVPYSAAICAVLWR